MTRQQPATAAGRAMVERVDAHNRAYHPEWDEHGATISLVNRIEAEAAHPDLLRIANEQWDRGYAIGKAEAAAPLPGGTGQQPAAETAPCNWCGKPLATDGRCKTVGCPASPAAETAGLAPTPLDVEMWVAGYVAGREDDQWRQDDEIAERAVDAVCSVRVDAAVRLARSDPEAEANEDAALTAVDAGEADRAYADAPGWASDPEAGGAG